VFAGAATALMLTSLLGVWLGLWLAKRLAPQILEKAAGISLLMIAVWLMWDVIQG
jgi:putative Ca2+/H+ antiporter (TMEM165/GDT1 family)